MPDTAASSFPLCKPFTQGAIDMITNYSWPGNVRELRNMITKLLIMNDTYDVIDERIVMKALNDKITKTQNDIYLSAQCKNTVEEAEKRLIIETLSNVNMCISSAARSLGITRNTLYRKIKKFGITYKKQLI